MVKYILLFVNIIAVLGIYLIADGDVIVSPKMPEEVRAGDDFTVEVTIRKGALNHYARFLQKLPPGFTAYPLNTQQAKFTFDESSAKFTWLSLPEEEEFTISYKVHVDTNVYGYFSFEGKFAYVDEDFERKAIAYSEWTTLLVLNDNYKDEIFAEDNAAVNNPELPKCSRIRSVSGAEVLVDLSIDNNKSKFAKIYEVVPPGYNAVSLNSNNGIFTFSNNTVKFMWQNCQDQKFNVQYKLIPVSGAVSSPPEIKGTYYYMTENRRTLNVTITDQSNLGNDNQMVASETDNSTTETSESSENSSIAEENGSQNAGNENSTNETSEVNNTAENVSNNNGESASSDANVNTSESETSVSNGENSTAEADQGSQGANVTFSVQICALRNSRPASFFNKNSGFRIPDKVNHETHEGWHKYTVGSFPVYLKARDFRNNLLNSTPASQAFIAAYNSGQRITVQEALMIAEQKWYQ